MSFLQPAMLLALPVMAVPIVIHLINQRRYQTVPWGAMAFLITANRMSRGYARIRQWLILAVRALALAGLVFMISRPLSSGWLGLAGGTQIDTTIILLDRSPSMMQRGASGQTKLAAAKQRLIESLKLVPANRYVLIDSVNLTPIEIPGPEALETLASTGAATATADLPSMLESVGDYVRDNRPSRCDVWICSDVRRSDWFEDSGRWQAIRNSLLELPQMIRFHLLAYTEPAPDNRSIRVTGSRLVKSESGTELLLSLRIRQSSPPEAETAIPVSLELNGARSELTVTMSDREVELVDHAIPLDDATAEGWGRVGLPADTNEADNQAFFVFDEPVQRRTLIVAEDAQAVRPLQLAAEIPPAPSVSCRTEIVSSDDLLGVEWDQISLVLWCSRLPGDDTAAALKAFLSRGGQVIFFPPSDPGEESFAGLRWTRWREAGDSNRLVGWVGDQDLLAASGSGTPLPAGQLLIDRYCGIDGGLVALATLEGGDPLLARATTEQRNVYFCATTVSPSDSTLAKNGVVLYVMIQRSLAAGAESLGRAREYVAGRAPVNGPSVDEFRLWKQEAGPAEALSTEFDAHAGVYSSGDNLIAIHRSNAEDETAIVPAEQVAGLFVGLPFDRVDDTTGGGASLVQEVWRLFLFGMIALLLVEAALCLPRKPQIQPGGVIA